MKYIVLCLFLLGLKNGNAQEKLVYADHIYKSSIHTVQLYKKGAVLSYPVLSLNSSVPLQLSFDDLSEDPGEYSYKIIHCEDDWTPSNITMSDYIDGFDYQDIQKYEYSFNTLVSYIHYSIDFPNEDLKILLSGNYLLVVFENHDEEQVVLTRRFWVVENQIVVEGTVKPSNLPVYKKTHQQVELTIKYGNLNTNGSNISQYLNVVIVPNNRWALKREHFQPTFIKDNALVYQYNDSMLFPGYNEYRYFETKSERYKSMNVSTITYRPPYYHFYLFPDQVRNFKQYTYHKDINGQYVVDVQEADNPATEADYVYVHFLLPYAVPLDDGDIYLSGAMVDWEKSETSKMKYDMTQKAYVKDLLLKQGHYNYCYTFWKNGSARPDDMLIEGSYYETTNDYWVYVYYKNPTERYTRLMAVKKLRSNLN